MILTDQSGYSVMYIFSDIKNGGNTYLRVGISNSDTAEGGGDADSNCCVCQKSSLPHPWLKCTLAGALTD